MAHGIARRLQQTQDHWSPYAMPSCAVSSCTPQGTIQNTVLLQFIGLTSSLTSHLIRRAGDKPERFPGLGINETSRLPAQRHLVSGLLK